MTAKGPSGTKPPFWSTWLGRLARPGRNGDAPKQPLEPLPAREFNSALRLSVNIYEPGSAVRSLGTPAKEPLVIPAGVRWEVSPSDTTVDLSAFIAEVQDQQLPGLSLRRLDDAGAERLAELSHLRWLTLASAWVTDAGLARLSGLPNLQSLGLFDAPVTGAGLSNLAGLTHLEELDLSGTRLTESGIAGLGQLVALRTLTLNRTPIADHWLAHLEALAELRTLSASDTPLTDAALPHLGRLRSLETLNLNETRITGAGVGLEGLTALRRLNLDSTPFTDAGLEPLSGARELRWLNLSKTKITGPGLAHLAGLAHFEQLWLSSARSLTDTGFASVEKLGRLTRLSLARTRLGDAAVSHLSSLGQLNDLDLYSTHISDAALPGLARLTSLQKLDLTGTNITATGLAQLSQALPSCEIEFRPSEEVTYERHIYAPSIPRRDLDLLPAEDLEDWMREAGAKVGIPRSREATGTTLLFLGQVPSSETSPEHVRFLFRKRAAAQEIRAMVHAAPREGSPFLLRVIFMDVQIWNQAGVANVPPADTRFTYENKRSLVQPWGFFEWVEASADKPARWEEFKRNDSRGRYQIGPERPPTPEEAKLRGQILYELSGFVTALPPGPWSGRRLED